MPGWPGCYWITWFARTRTEWGIVSPRALAVFSLMTSSKRVGCSTEGTGVSHLGQLGLHYHAPREKPTSGLFV